MIVIVLEGGSVSSKVCAPSNAEITLYMLSPTIIRGRLTATISRANLRTSIV